MAKAKDYTKALVLMQYVDGKPKMALVFNEDAKTEKAWRNHAELQASFISWPTKATVVEMRPREAADYLHRNMPDLKVSMMGNQKKTADEYFSAEGRTPDEKLMREYGFIPTKAVESPIPF